MMNDEFRLLAALEQLLRGAEVIAPYITRRNIL